MTSPRVVGRYALFDAIASGGMASVHFGRLMGPVGFSRTVAIKRLHETYAQDPEFVAMFMDEARLAARVRHPNVVPTLDVVALDHELLLVMEYISGESLSLLLRRARAEKRPTPIPVVVDIMIHALSGLHAAHEAVNESGEPINIVHRDVSPQNILVGTDGVTRVLDFGVAKAVGRAHHTREGQIKGKIRYMAPEQVRGKGVTRTADIYAASVVLWEALTGERLFQGDSDAEVMYKVIEGQVVPPSKVRPEISRELDAIVMRGLRSNPAERYPTAQVMAHALESAVPPVARSAVRAWVLENANDAIQKRSERLAYVESTGMRALVRNEYSQPAPPTEKRDSSEANSSLTPPSVEASVPPPNERSDRDGWRSKRTIALVAAIALAIGSIPTLLTYKAAAPRGAAAASMPPPEALSVLPMPVPPPPPTPVPDVVMELPATPDASPVVNAESAPMRKHTPPAASPIPKLVAPKVGSDRLYRRD